MILAKLLRLWPGIQEAKAAAETSKGQQQESRLLTDEVARLHQENHITARIHTAMRGGRG